MELLVQFILIVCIATLHATLNSDSSQKLSSEIGSKGISQEAGDIAHKDAEESADTIEPTGKVDVPEDLIQYYGESTKKADYNRYFGGLGKKADYNRYFGGLGKKADYNRYFGGLGKKADYNRYFGGLGKKADYNRYFGGLGKKADYSRYFGGLGKKADYNRYFGGLGKRADYNRYFGGLGKKADYNRYLGGLGKKADYNRYLGGLGKKADYMRYYGGLGKRESEEITEASKPGQKSHGLHKRDIRSSTAYDFPGTYDTLPTIDDDQKDEIYNSMKKNPDESDDADMDAIQRRLLVFFQDKYRPISLKRARMFRELRQGKLRGRQNEMYLTSPRAYDRVDPYRYMFGMGK